MCMEGLWTTEVHTICPSATHLFATLLSWWRDLIYSWTSLQDHRPLQLCPGPPKYMVSTPTPTLTPTASPSPSPSPTPTLEKGVARLRTDSWDYLFSNIFPLLHSVLFPTLDLFSKNLPIMIQFCSGFTSNLFSIFVLNLGFGLWFCRQGQGRNEGRGWKFGNLERPREIFNSFQFVFHFFSISVVRALIL